MMTFIHAAAVEFVDPIGADPAVYGHVSDDEADAAMAARYYELSDYEGEEILAPDHGPWRHAWAEWRDIEEDDFVDGDVEMIFEIHLDPGEGRFPVTLAETVEHIERRELRRRRKAEITAAAQAACPYAKVEGVGGLDGDGYATLSAGGVVATWSERSPGVVRVSLAASAAWIAARDAWRASRPGAEGGHLPDLPGDEGEGGR